MTDAELVARYDGRVPRYTSYPTAPHFSPAVGAESLRPVARRAAAPRRRSSLYLHVPFCDRLCYYCGCNTTVVRLDSSLRAYAALVEREIERVAGVDRPPRGRSPTSIGAAARRPACPPTGWSR